MEESVQDHVRQLISSAPIEKIAPAALRHIMGVPNARMVFTHPFLKNHSIGMEQYQGPILPRTLAETDFIILNVYLWALFPPLGGAYPPNMTFMSEEIERLLTMDWVDEVSPFM